jgi:hypothetical protein
MRSTILSLICKLIRFLAIKEFNLTYGLIADFEILDIEIFRQSRSEEPIINNKIVRMRLN